MEIEIPLQSFMYNDKNVLDELYKERTIPTTNISTEEFLKLPPTEAYLNNKERIAREAKEKAEREEWERKFSEKENKVEIIYAEEIPEKSG